VWGVGNPGGHRKGMIGHSVQGLGVDTRRKGDPGA
jgi:hypothetical protein